MPISRLSRRAFWPCVLTALLFLFFAAALLSAVQSSPLLFDASLHAIVARNIAAGYGWAMSYPARDLLVSISTGPTLILPAAAMMAVFGNAFWVPALTASLINVLLFAIFLWQLRKLCRTYWQLPLITLGLSLLFLHFESVWWTLLIGEVTAWLLFLIACTVAADPHLQSGQRRYFLLGILTSLSLLARMMTLPAFAGLGCYLLWQEYQAWKFARQSMKGIFNLLLSGLAGLILASVPFRLYEISHFILSDGPTYWDNLRYRMYIYRTNPATGLGKLLLTPDPLGTISNNINTNYTVMMQLLQSYGLSGKGLLALLAGMLALLFHPGYSARKPLAVLINTLCAAFIFYCLWYFFVCQTGSFDRYALLPLLTLFSLVVLLVASRLGWFGIPALLAIMLIVTPDPRLQTLKELLLHQDVSWLDGNAQLINETSLEAAEYLKQHPARYPLANCGWMGTTRELEYLLPEPENFLNCFDLIQAALEPDTDTGSYRWRQPVEFTLVINRAAWRMAKSHKPSALRHRYLMQACRPQTRFHNTLFQVMDCPFESLKNHIPLDADTPFIDQFEWMEERPLSGVQSPSRQ